MKGRVLIVAGSDSGGGAGIQGDLKTVICLGGYGMTAITALTAQNTQGVFGIHPVPEDFITQQMELCLDDLGADALKTGMLHSDSVIRTVARVIREKAKHLPLVVDPVMVAKGGASLLETSAVECLKTELLPLATLFTPNIPEAERLSGIPIRNVDDMERAAHLLHSAHGAVLVKGGHLEGNELVDLLLDHDGVVTRYRSPRIATTHTHGTGCALASAVATGLAQGMPLKDSVERARTYVQEAIRHAPGLGHGHGPLGHNHTVLPFAVD